MFEQSRSIPRALTANEHSDPDAARLAIRWVAEQFDVVGGQILLLVPSKGNFSSMNNLFTQFAKAREVTVDTTRGHIAWPGGPVLAAWPTMADITQLDDDRRTRALCVFAPGADADAWASAHSPELLGDVPTVSAPVIDPVVVQGLLQITRMVNHANNLAGSLDRRDAVAVLRLLHRGGYELPHREIYAWALAHGWPGRGAERLREFAERIDSGRTVQLKGPSPLRDDALQRWQASAATADSE